MIDEKLVQREAESCYGQFVSSKPDRHSFLGGFHVGAVWAEHELKLTWLTERPTVPGWYWFEGSKGTANIQYMGPDDYDPSGCRVAGPISRPAEPCPSVSTEQGRAS